MAENKKQTSPEDFCVQNAKLFVPALEFVYTIGFEERPDYSKICFLLKKALLDIDIIPTQFFYWKDISISELSVAKRNEG